MNLTFTYEDITDEEAQELIGGYIDNHSKLVKQGETNIKRKLEPIAELIEREIGFYEYTYYSVEKRLSWVEGLIKETLKDLKNILEAE